MLDSTYFLLKINGSTLKIQIFDKVNDRSSI